jgi:ribose-phosphate pyrophosphokinase
MTNDVTFKASSFFTPERYAAEHKRLMESPRGQLLIASCRSGSYLAEKVVARYNEILASMGSGGEVLFLGDVDTNFSDTETNVRLNMHISGYDVFLFQALLDPTSGRSIDQNYMSLLIAARAFRENGAHRVTAVLPYLAYARQDKPTKFEREPTTARLMADLSIASGIDRLVVWAPHSGQIRGFYGGYPVQMLESLTTFINEYAEYRGREDVIVVAPDEGAAKFVTHFGRAMGLTYAVASKFRPRPEAAEIKEIMGDFEGKTTAIILDDMISGGGTMQALTQKLAEETGIREIQIGISHNLCVPGALGRIREMREKYHLRRVLVTNSIPQTEEFRKLEVMKEICLSEILARTINRIHYDRSVSEIFYRPGE